MPFASFLICFVVTMGSLEKINRTVSRRFRAVEAFSN